jgi:CRP/FNR family transcriptional regulator
MAATREETIELLHGVPAFSTLAVEELSKVAEVAVPRTLAAGEVVFREGDESDTCYIVRSGHARAVREHPDGRSLTLANFGPGDIFGELAMFGGERRSATIETLDEVELLAILGSDMRRLLREHPDI